MQAKNSMELSLRWAKRSHEAHTSESALFGINANNLVEPQEPVVPQLKDIQFKSYFETLPLIMPKPFLIQSEQRPFPIPN